MVRHEFDDLSRRFANNPSRRALLKAIIGGAIGVRFGAAIHSAAAEDATPIAGCSVDEDCGIDSLCCGETCQQVECCAGDLEDTHCGRGQICAAGFCQAPSECSVDTDCDPCNACMSGVCTWLCGETCGATCDESAGEHGTCRFDCRAGDGNSCCELGQICDRQTGVCGTREELFGSLAIMKVDENGNALRGACFDLIDPQSGEVLTPQPACDGGFGDSDGAANGTVLFANNVRGIFQVRESVAPQGYLPASDQITQQIHAGETATLTFVDKLISSSPEPTTAPPVSSGGSTTTTTTTLPNTGGDDGSDSHRSWWLSGAALIGGAAALLGGKRMHKTGDES